MIGFRHVLAGLCLLATCTIKAQSSDSLIVRQLQAKHISFSHNNAVTLLMNGQEKFNDLFQAIADARHSIHMEYFNFRNDSINQELIARLAVKAQQGVKVRCVFDGFGNSSNNRPIRAKRLKEIRQLGINIYEFNPVRFPWLNDFFNRDHRKIVVIDGKIAYTGGMNVADYYIKGTKAVGSWNDMHCRIEGEAVNTLQAIFLRMWKKVSGEEVHGEAYFGGHTPALYFHGLKPDTTATHHHKLVGIINKEPHHNSDIIRTFYLDAINDAKDSIKIITPYFTLSPRLKKALKKAAWRGVKVEIMLSTKSDIPLTPDCGFYNAHQLMKAGCHIWMYTPGFQHTKLMMVDGLFCTIGSANLNARSLRWDREENAVIVDQYTTKELDRLFEQDKNKSFLLTEERWKQWRTPAQRILGWWAHWLSPFL